MTQILFVAIAVALFSGVALLGWWFSGDEKARRAMRSVPRRRIENVIDGELVRVVGQVEVDEVIEAPLSGRPCAYWRVTVEEQRHLNGPHWATIIDVHEEVEFAILDGASRALIKTAFTQVVLERDGQFSSYASKDATPRLEAFLAARGHKSQGWVFTKNMRYRERVVEPGEQVCVVGVGRWERNPKEKPSAGGGYREVKAPKRLVMSTPENGPLLLSDEPALTKS